MDKVEYHFVDTDPYKPRYELFSNLGAAFGSKL